MAGFETTRRSLIVGSGVSLLASACGREDEGTLIASAARNGNRQTFVDTVAWEEPNGKSLVVAFVPWMLSEQERRAAVADRGVYPALSFERPLLEVRMEVDPSMVQAVSGGPKVLRISKATLRAVQFTFWFFDDPTPVIRIEKDEWPVDPDIEVTGLDGELRRDGWVVGAIRSRQLHKNARNVDEAYLVNLRFIQSLS